MSRRPLVRACCLTAVLATAGCGVTAASQTPSAPAAPTPTSAPDTTAPAGTSTTSATTASGRLPPIIHRGTGLGFGQKVPLLIALHGTDSSPTGMQYITRMDRVANAHGFVVAYLASADPPHSWNPQTDDLQYVHSMIGQLEHSQNIDPTRIYVTGFSAGGYEAWKLACTYPSEIAGIAIVANTMNLQLYNQCRLSHPVSQYVLVGGADGIRVTGVAGRLPSAAQTADKWHVLDGCSNPPTRSVPQAGVVVQTWKSCIDGSSVAYTVVAGGLHNWPGGPTISTAPDPYSSRYDASDAIWNFLSAHRLSPTTVAGKLLSLTASVGRRGRAIVAKFRLGEPVRVVASLSGHGRPLRYRSMSLRAGASTRLQLGLPAKTAPGRYTLKLAMTDSYGRKLALSRSIAVPKPKH